MIPDLVSAKDPILATEWNKMVEEFGIVPRCVSGQYTGNGTINRAIEHGLGRIPAFVFITTHFGTWGGIQGSIISSNPTINRSAYITGECRIYDYTTIAMNETYFYVSYSRASSLGASSLNSYNLFDWVAIG